MKQILSMSMIVLIMLFIVPVNAKNTGPVLAVEQFNGAQISFASNSRATNTSVSIVGPDGFSAQKSVASGMPSFNLYEYGQLTDGLYLYEMSSSAGKRVLFKDTVNNGRGEQNSHYAQKSIRQSGHFRVVNGQIKRYKQIKEATDHNSTTY
jgi:hypothetical protein